MKEKLGKGKAVICGMLGAAMISTQKDKHNVKQVEKEPNETLLELTPCFGGGSPQSESHVSFALERSKRS